MNKVRFTTYLTPELKEALGKAAKDRDCSESYVIALALRAFISPPSKAQKDISDE